MRSQVKAMQVLGFVSVCREPHWSRDMINELAFLPGKYFLSNLTAASAKKPQKA